jgi:chromosome segregation ATPase
VNAIDLALTRASNPQVRKQSEDELRCKETEMMRDLERRSQRYADKCKELEKSVRDEMESLALQRRELNAQREHERNVVRQQVDREVMLVVETHQKQLLKEKSLFEVSKLQLEHQRDELHHQLGSMQDAAQDAKERDLVVKDMAQVQVQTLASLEASLEQLREVARQNEQTIQTQQRDLARAQEQVAESAKLMVAADERERALRLHFEQVRLLVSTQHVHSRLD